MNHSFRISYFAKIVYAVMFFVSVETSAVEYKIPPTSSTSGSAPYISDKAMEECVKLYNQAVWLKNEIDTLQVDRYSQNSVSNYNNKVNRYSKMIKKFNRDCAGKQSYSAWKAVQKLNK